MQTRDRLGQITTSIKERMKSSSSGARYFNPRGRGELGELRKELNANNRDTVGFLLLTGPICQDVVHNFFGIKEAVKKVIANMTVGKDVSSLFADVIRSMNTQDVELKKLIYLYIMNYARSQPELAILVVASFAKDASSPSPLIRALAIRTMGCIRVDKITEHLCEPLTAALRDKDPYVRKTAAVCVAKLYSGNPELVEDQGMVAALQDLLNDSNPMVVANAVSTLSEIAQGSGQDLFQFTEPMIQKLLVALNECTEWGQTVLLDVLSKYQPTEDQALSIVQRVLPRTKHANPAVVLSAVNVIMGYGTFMLNRLKSQKQYEQSASDLKALTDRENQIHSIVEEKVPPSLLTLLSSDQPEIVYVTLRNISLLLQQRPNLFERNTSGITHFFCKYNDPLFVKMEKLDLLVRLASETTVERVLQELKEYCNEVDIPFARKSVSCIGQVAIRVQSAPERCVKTLHSLAMHSSGRAAHIVQEVVIAFRDIFRRYPNRYEKVIDRLYQHSLNKLESDSEAKAAMIWIIGEYSDRIKEAPDILKAACETFLEDSAVVQLQTLTACAKLHLCRPQDGQKLVTRILRVATKECRTVDVRDRAYMYWRLLSTNPDIAMQVILAQRPTISREQTSLPEQTLDELARHLAAVSSVYHTLPKYFLKDHNGDVILRSDSTGTLEDGASEESTDSSSSDDTSDDDEAKMDANSLENEVRRRRRERQSRRRRARRQSAQATENTGVLDIFAGVSDDSITANISNPSSVESSHSNGDAASATQFDLLDLLGDTDSRRAGSGGISGELPGNISSSTGASSVPPSAQLGFSASDGAGLELYTEFVVKADKPWFDMRLYFHNQSPDTINRFAIRFDSNVLGLKPGASLRNLPPLVPGGNFVHVLPITTDLESSHESVSTDLHAALKTDAGVFYFCRQLPWELIFSDQPGLSKTEFLSQWPSLDADNDSRQSSLRNTTQNLADMKSRFHSCSIRYVAKSKNPDRGMLVYFSARLLSHAVLVEINILSSGLCNLTCKSSNKRSSLVASLACAQIIQS